MSTVDSGAKRWLLSFRGGRWELSQYARFEREPREFRHVRHAQSNTTARALRQNWACVPWRNSRGSRSKRAYWLVSHRPSLKASRQGFRAESTGLNDFRWKLE